MIRTFLRIMLGIGFVTFILGTPPADAIFGIRAARTALAARKAKKLASSQADETTPQMKGKDRGAGEREDPADVTP